MLPPSVLAHLNRTLDVPLHLQVYEGLREAILQGTLKPSHRLPSTRAMAQHLGVSRNTVLLAFEQLLLEGYLESRVGDGTYVTHTLPDTSIQKPEVRMEQQGKQPQLSRRAQKLLQVQVTQYLSQPEYRAFRSGMPALKDFPFEEWRRLHARHWKSPPVQLLSYGDPRGYLPLREAISEYLNASRGVRCTPDQVLITSGSQQGLELAARLLMDDGDSIWMEDPGYLGARAAFQASGLSVCPIPIDQEGMQVQHGATHHPNARMVYVTPSHQYPLGITLSLTRRLELLKWARQSEAWILEDDYNSEYRYEGRPLNALQGLDQDGRVIYIGTFSKVLLPAVRLGYLVLPENLIDLFIHARSLVDRMPPGVSQAVLAEFMENGGFERHIRRMRGLYAERQTFFLNLAHTHFPDWLSCQPSPAGMHLVSQLSHPVSDVKLVEEAKKVGVTVRALSPSYLQNPKQGLLFGYAGFPEDESILAARDLGRAYAVLRVDQK